MRLYLDCNDQMPGGKNSAAGIWAAGITLWKDGPIFLSCVGLSQLVKL
jgi:hypothetical protein